MPTRAELRSRRSYLTLAWDRYLRTDMAEREGAASTGGLRSEIVASWDRSAIRVSPAVTQAPLSDPAETEACWQASPLGSAVAVLEPEFQSAADDGDLVVAITDPGARILWTAAGRVMRPIAEKVNFVPGSDWNERSVGTNALDLALRLDQAATVYSAEHFSSPLHDWVLGLSHS